MIYNHVILANLKIPITVAEVEPIALAIAPHLAMGALVFFHPLAVTVDLIFVLPNLPETVMVDVALMVVAADAQTARNGAVGED